MCIHVHIYAHTCIHMYTGRQNCPQIMPEFYLTSICDLNWCKVWLRHPYLTNSNHVISYSWYWIPSRYHLPGFISGCLSPAVWFLYMHEYIFLGSLWREISRYVQWISENLRTSLLTFSNEHKVKYKFSFYLFSPMAIYKANNFYWFMLLLFIFCH